MKGKSTYPITAFLLAVVLCAVSCLQEEVMEPQQNKAAFTIVGNPVEVHLGITVSGLSVGAGTRAEEPTAGADVEDTEAERHVDDLWLFEYSSSTKELIYPPIYLTISEQKELADIKMTLSDNDGNPVTIYVVTNSGSGVEENGKNWVVAETVGDEISYTGFMTIGDLEANSLPTPHPQRMIWDGEKYVIQYYDEAIIDNISIPMSGSVEETVKKDAEILVPVDRMYAKLMITVDLSDFDNYSDQSASLYALSIGNIPEYCRVGTLWDNDRTDTAQPADYSECEQWIQRRFNGDGMAEDIDPEKYPDIVYPYIIYVPENIQGENGSGDSGKADNVPIPEGSTSTRALNTEASVNVTLQDGAVIGPYTYTAYPGGNSKTNFNIRRNCVYRVTLKVGYPIVLNAVPSANCIVCLSGQTTTFFPYCREETGGGYDFTDYLNAYDDTGAKKIDHVGIIWQSTNGGNTVGYSDTADGFIGDNSSGDLVWIDDLEDVMSEYHRKIYVKIPEDSTGNALVAAYNSEDEIIWSWHIWARTPDTDPTTVGTKLYYTYEWDSNGIYGRDSEHPRVAGYTIMNSNLGAMQDDPSGSVYVPSGSASGRGLEGFENARVTFGMLYQWGRKDPFPPITKHISTTQYGGTYATDMCIAEYNVEAVGNYFDNSNNAVSIVGANDSTALFYSVPGTERQKFDIMIPLTIQNPTVFYAGTNDVNQVSVNYERTNLASNMPEPKDGNWILDNGGDHFNRLWGGLDPEQDMDKITKSFDTGYTCTLGETKNIPVHLYDDYGSKSIFDPCPYGWRVSPPDLWLGFTDTGLNAGSGGDSLDNVNYDTNEDNSNFSGMTMYMTAWRTGATSFFPAQGTRSPDGCALRVGQCGNYNNATADANDRVNIMHTHYQGKYFNIFEVEYMDFFIKSTAGPVRCVRVSSVQQ